MGISKDSGRQSGTIFSTFKELLCRSPLRKLINSSRSSRGGRKMSGAGACRVAPEGCFTVYVGPEKRRFVVETKHANHTVFRRLLDEAACEYGYQRDGPILLPCDVDLFCRVLAEMDGRGRDGDDDEIAGGGGGPHGGIRRRGVRAYWTLRTSWAACGKQLQGGRYSRLGPRRSLQA